MEREGLLLDAVLQSIVIEAHQRTVARRALGRIILAAI